MLEVVVVLNPVQVSVLKCMNVNTLGCRRTSWNYTNTTLYRTLFARFKFTLTKNFLLFSCHVITKHH